MHKTKIDQTFHRLVQLLYQLGIWRNVEESAFGKLIKKIIYLVYFNLFIIFIVSCACMEDDKIESFFLWQVALVVSVITIKLYYILWKKDQVLTFLYTRTTECYSEFNDDNKKMKNFMKFVKAYYFMLVVSGLVYIASTLPMFSRERMLPFFIRFKLTGEYSEIIYWIAFVFVGSNIFLCNVFNLITSIIWYVMLNFGIEYETLGSKFRKLGTNKKLKRQTLKKPTSVHQAALRRSDEDLRELIDLIKTHRTLSKTIEEFRSCFFTLFLAQMTTSGTAICVSTYNLSNNSQADFFQSAIFVAILLYTIFDIFVVMYLANEIKEASSRVSYCLFESNWTEQSDSYKKCMIIMCEFLKQPQQLTILIYPMNLDTFTMIINGAYTMLNILKNFE